jgi:hypothetical protein
MSETKTFIRYQNRNPKRPDVIYATLCTPQRTNNKKINNEKYLGRVINKENRIFYNKNDNYYQLSENNIKLDLSKKDLEFYKDADKCIGTKKGTVKKDKIYKNRQIIDFGASFTIYQSFKSHKFDTLFDFKSPQERDSLIALILFRIIEQKGYSSAYDWWSRDYIQYLCPYAKLKSQRISEFLAKIGTEKFFRDFFKNYIVFIKNLDNNSNILIDSTGLPNSIKCPYTAINNHNGKISKEIRLISVIDKVTGYPVYYRYVPGNIVDVKTLKNTIFELQEYGININRLILDAGYYSEENLKELYRLQIPFMTRMIPRYSIYDLLINKYAPNIIDHDNFIEYGSRNHFIKKVLIKLFDDQIPVFAYICSDPEKKINDEREYMHNYNHEKSTREKFNQDYL